MSPPGCPVGAHRLRWWCAPSGVREGQSGTFPRRAGCPSLVTRNVRYSVISVKGIDTLSRNLRVAAMPATRLTMCPLSRTLPSMSPLILRVRELREALGLTQAELADRAGVRRATVNRIENARVTAVDLSVLERIADVLRVEPGFIIVRVADAKDSNEHPTKSKRSRR